MIFTPADLTACVAEELPERAGPCYLGLDFGGATSAARRLVPSSRRRAALTCGLRLATFPTW